MPGLNLLVLSNPVAHHLAALASLPEETTITVSDNLDGLSKAAPGADVVLNCTGQGELLGQLWPSMPRLRWVHSLAAGVEAQLLPYMVDSDIPLTNSRGVYAESLGEFVLAAVLYFAKDFRRMIRNQEERKWDSFDVEEIAGQTAAIVGYGEIGRASARRLKAMGMKVHALRRRPELNDQDRFVDLTFGTSDLIKMVTSADYVVVTAPLTPETRGMIGSAELAAMKPTASIINVGRGPVIDESALIDALKANRIRGSALDVFNQEPLPGDHAFWSLDNLLLSPHCADHVPGWLDAAMKFFLENFERFRLGEPLKNIVDKRAGY